ncbi:hypothetical protein LTR05_004683 [Lithohypha guttulata]|uniref:Peptidase S8/S53 domain-containing protein n=1 Tax=Lithohypha guttulata TaxID=1690604 RepID=A0AAN7T037_9EURO|nr:hypothetical protein LTR05_004683 [Lithohypha guttulata]
MAIMGVATLISVFVFFSFTKIVFAGEEWFVFYPDVFADNYNRDWGDGQPSTNAEFEEILASDAVASTMYASKSNVLESTWFWTAKVEEETVTTKYFQFNLLRGIAIHPEDDRVSSGPSYPWTPPKKNRPSKTTRWAKRAIQDQQDNAPRQLKFLSMTEDQHNDLDHAEYKYAHEPGKYVRVYVVDHGINPNSVAFIGRRVEWIFSEPFSNHQQVDTDLDEDKSEYGHGTCMADLAVGKINGVAKDAEITAVQEDTRTGIAHTFPMEHMIDGMSKALDDIVMRAGPSVVLMAFDFRTEDNEPFRIFDDAFSQILAKMDQIGVSLVTSVPSVLICPGPPCSYGNPGSRNYIPDLITVGEGNILDGAYGTENPSVRTPWTTLYAPGSDSDENGEGPGILCADPKDNNANNDWHQSGTSHASALVAGLMAYYRGLGLDKTAARQTLLGNTYARVSDGPLMPWNGYTGS